MTYHVGLDVSLKETDLCVPEEGGRPIGPGGGDCSAGSDAVGFAPGGA